MHASTATVGTSALPPKQLGNQRLRCHSFGKRVTVAAMGAEDGVVVIEVCTNARCDRLFTHVGVAGTVNQTALVASSEMLLSAANLHHLAKQRK